jgi:cell division septation protein DedD
MAGLARRSLATLTTFVLLAAVGFTLGALAGVLWEEPRMIISYLRGGTTEIAWRGDEAPAEGEEELPDVAAAPEVIEPLAISPDRPARPTEREKPPAADPAPAPLKPPPAPAPPVVVDRNGAVFAGPPPEKPMVVDSSSRRFTSTLAKEPQRSEPAPVAGKAGSSSSARRFAIQVGAFAKSESAEGLAQRLSGRGYDAYVTPGAGKGNARWRVRVGPVQGKSSAEALASKLKKNEKLPTWILDEGGE